MFGFVRLAYSPCINLSMFSTSVKNRGNRA